jgi:polyisoprenoid-binding protein YceI
MSAKIDVRQPVDATETPWEGSVNIPVYQMTFVDEVRKRFGAEEPIVLRGYREDLSARFAKGKLEKYGFTAVSIAEDGFPAAEEEPGEAASGGFPADPARSRVAWTGRNIASSHFGSIPLVEGTLRVEDGRLTGLSLAVDMTKISCEDIEDPEMAKVLEAHLKNEDFFEADRFPVAKFTSTRIEQVDGPDSPRVSVTGDLEIRGVVNEVSVEGVFGKNFEGDYAASASFDLDRTEWGALYGSPRFFRRLLGHFVREEVSLSVTLVAGS